MSEQPAPLDFAPGIQRDGTMFEGQRAVDALWCRWRLARPRKMGGFQQITDLLTGIPRRIHVFYQGATATIHIGTTQGLQQVVIDYSGNLINMANRTPTGFSASATATWTFDAIFDTNTGVVQLVAHSAPNAGSPTSTVQTVPYIGQITATGQLAQFSVPSTLGGGAYVQPSVAGGVVSVQPYIFDFDANGLVQWSAPNVPLALGVTGGTTGAGSARISAQKIMAGAPLRGGGTQQPAVIFWSLSEVITGSFVGSNAGIFAFSTVSPSTSILSGGGVIEDGGLFYWPGIDRFYVYNGTVQELPNQQNLDWFFANLNWSQVGKIQAFKIPRYGEVCWLAPMFGNTECSHMIIYNSREQCWYDTVLPNAGRGCGYFAQGLRYPVMGGVTNDGNGYSLWLHEAGTDQVAAGVTSAVRSYFETPYFGGPKNQPASNNGLSIQQLEPDVILAGDMTVQIIGAANARAPVSTGAAVPLKASPSVPQEQFVSFNEGHRLTRLHIESNVVGGNYIFGRNLLHAAPAEKRLIS